MSLITDEMVETAVAAADGILEVFEMRAALEAVANDIRNQTIEECACKCFEHGGEHIEPGAASITTMNIASAIRSLKTKDPA